MSLRVLLLWELSCLWGCCSSEGVPVSEGAAPLRALLSLRVPLLWGRSCLWGCRSSESAAPLRALLSLRVPLLWGRSCLYKVFSWLHPSSSPDDAPLYLPMTLSLSSDGTLFIYWWHFFSWWRLPLLLMTPLLFSWWRPSSSSPSVSRRLQRYLD